MPTNKNINPDQPRFINFSASLSYYIPAYLIVFTLCFIALPKQVTNSFFTKDSAASPLSPNTDGHLNNADSVAAAIPEKYKKDALQKNAHILKVERSVNPSSDSPRAIADIAKLALETSNEKYDSIKESNDRLFSLIAAMGALIAFLGFKGVDSFMAARSNTEKIIKQAAEAQKKAVDAGTQLDHFLTTKYPKDTSAEINVSHGLVLREIADTYFDMVKLIPNYDTKSAEAKYHEYLNKSLYYIDSALKETSSLESKLIRRALGTKCNIYRRLNKVERALETAEEIIEKYADVDESGHYNASCYCCLLAKEASSVEDHQLAATLTAKSINYLREAIKMQENNRYEALGDPDFKEFRDNKNAEFLALTK